mgnify:CR=1 FL=1
MREHCIWQEKRLISIGGGKLTTYRLIAKDALKRVIPDQVKGGQKRQKTIGRGAAKSSYGLNTRVHELSCLTQQRLTGRFGNLWVEVISKADPDELEPIAGTNTLWAELRWAARNEGVVHLDDLLMRRTRLGILLKSGGLGNLQRIKSVCQEELGWDEHQWEQELAAYRNLWDRCYSIPE